MLSRKIIIFKCSNGSISYNYNYPLMKIIYNLMSNTNSEFSLKLHNEGFKADEKSFKLFNFALQFENVKYEKTGIAVNENSIIKLVISGKNDILNLIVKGLITSQQINLNTTTLTIENFQDDKKFTFKNIMLFKVRTPIVESTYDAKEKKINYLNPCQQDFYKALGQNLLRKYKALYNKDYEGELYFDIENMLNPKKKYITQIKNNGFLIGYTDFEIFIQADKDMQMVAYYLGLGQNTSMGMGNITYITGRSA